MRLFLLILIGLLAASPLFALEGRLVFLDGNPVADAEVSILGRSGSTRTDRMGRFTWQPDPPLPFELLVVLPGGQYMAPVLVEKIPEEGPLLVSISPLVQESITVAAGTVPHIEAPPASGMSLLAREELEQRHPARLADVLEHIPGTGRLGEGHAAVPSIRGLARGRTLILIDGARVTTERRAGPSASYLDPFFLEGVEVSRGPGSVAYGSDAFGGVIHVRTRRAEPGSPLRFRFLGSVGAGLPEWSGGVEVARGFAEGGLIFQARFRDFGDYRSPAGEVSDSGAADRGFLARAYHEVGRGRLSVGWQTDLGRDMGRPTTTSFITRVSYPREDSHRLTLAYDLDPLRGFTRIGLSGFLASHSQLTEQDRLPTPAEPRQVSRSDVSARDFGFRALAVRPLGRARLEFGLDLNGRFKLEALDSLLDFDSAQNLVSKIDEISVESASRTDTGLYLTGEALLAGRITAAGGFRIDHVTTGNQGGFFGRIATAQDAFSGFASLTAGPFHGLALTGQVSRGFRDPSLSDRYFRGVSGRGFVSGNPGLGPESSFQLDLAVRYVARRFRWALYAYRYRIHDLIERFESGEDLFFLRNQGEALLRGVEIEAQGEMGRGIALELGAQMASGSSLAEEGRLADIPVESITVLLRKKLRERGYLQIRASLYGRDEEPGPTEKVTPGYASIDLGGGWRLKPKVELRLLLRNALDKDYPASPDEKAVLAPGIAGLATLVASF